MKILILGADGYLGWPTVCHFHALGHEVEGVDSYDKRIWETEVGGHPLWDRGTMVDRNHGRAKLHVFDIAGSYRSLAITIRDFQPDAIVHYAEQPSAPYSMMGARYARSTQINNVAGTLNLLFAVQREKPDCHIIKLGTMGEYGTPNIDIEEGWLDVEHNGRTDRVLYPKRPGSFYHLSKVHDSHNLEFACRIWGLRVTDLNQGVVYGTHVGKEVTSFHYDAIFGTVLNRFIVQAVAGMPLTVYGLGEQTRGFLNIMDTMKCVQLAAENPPEAGEFWVINQFTEQFSINDLALKVSKLTGAKIVKLPNPRIEAENHYYNAKHTTLPELGLEPALLTDDVLRDMLDYVSDRMDNFDPSKVEPTVKWRMRSE